MIAPEFTRVNGVRFVYIGVIFQDTGKFTVALAYIDKIAVWLELFQLMGDG